VRQWRNRERHATEEIAKLLGESEKPRKKGKWQPNESEVLTLARAGARLAKALTQNNLKYAKRLALQYLEAYGIAGLA